MSNFIPNWQRIGLKNKDDAVLLALGEIKKEEKILKKLGLANELVFVWKGKTIEI